jgi:hypothetical protein
MSVFAQAAIELQGLGNVLRDLVAASVTADDEVLASALVVGIGRGLRGMGLRGMLPGARIAEFRRIETLRRLAKDQENDR